MQKITPCLWFDDNAEEAVDFYTSVFKDAKIEDIAQYGEDASKASGRPKGSVMTITFQLHGQEFMALNGGPIFKFTPAISFFVYCNTEKEINELFAKLSESGQVLMALDKYPFSERYAFISDKFGLSWQLILADSAQKIVPCLLFVGKDLGKAEAAVQFYKTVFRHAGVHQMSHYGKGENGKEGTVMHSSFSLDGQKFTAMDGTGSHMFAFNESVSFMVNCREQDEVDYYWEELSKSGMEVQCGWLKDKFGISWQIVPTALGEMMKDAKKSEMVMTALLQMKKLDIRKLKQAYDQQ